MPSEFDPARWRTVALLPLILLISGCHAVVLDPAGDVAARQKELLVQSTLLMLVIIIPVMALTVWYAWKYRASNTKAPYDPNWHHSTRLELVIWAAPLLIIICLGALTWLGTHLLDPYRPLDRVGPGQPVPQESKPLQVNVVALDWKWLFIYPEYGIATVNELTVPIGRPIRLHITASSVMNSLYIPNLAGQIYAMPGMETQLNGVVNRPVNAEGFSANYSGAGFSGMRFGFHGVPEAQFDAWLEKVRGSELELTRAEYLELARPSERERPRHYARAETSLYHHILNQCVAPDLPCTGHTMAHH
jgi:cytochrome o ubiquinol oxidase subunit II